MRHFQEPFAGDGVLCEFELVGLVDFPFHSEGEFAPGDKQYVPVRELACGERLPSRRKS